MKLHYRFLYSAVNLYTKWRYHPGVSVATLRERFGRVSAFSTAQLKQRYPKVSCVPFDVEGVPAEWMDATPEVEKPLVLYLHGGGYFMGGIDTHRAFALRLSFRCRVKVCSIDYRLAPEHPHPAALEDALKSFRWLKKSFPKHKLFIGGDSAGGGLTLATVMALRDNGDGLPDGIFCFSPWTDLMGTGESLKTRRHRDCILSSQGVEIWREFYAGSVRWKEPLVSPLYGNYEGFPPMQIYVGEEELLLDDSLRVAQKAESQGVKVQLIREPQMQHDWPLLFHQLPEARKALDTLKTFLA